MTAVPARRLQSFGAGRGQINAIIVINLDRQPNRWRLLIRELGRFKRSDGLPLTEMTRRFSAVDARDGRAVAATADVDITYRVGDQLWVQPDARLAESFDADEPVRMTRQEVAVARSHIEVWKMIAAGPHRNVLVLEDDVWFRPGARAAVDNGWRDAVANSAAPQGPQLLYVSYVVADPRAPRRTLGRSVFRPTRGLWFLSGYVLSRDGAAALLRAMPVVGPVDLWMNYQLEGLDALALTSPALAQRNDIASGNAYSILPYLARAGIVDAEREVRFPDQRQGTPVFGWSGGGEHEALAMALSMLGLRVRAFNGDEQALDPQRLREVLQTFDALVDPPLEHEAVSLISSHETAIVVAEQGAAVPNELRPAVLGSQRSLILEGRLAKAWGPLCRLLGVEVPVEPYPTGVPRTFAAFRDARPQEHVGLLRRSEADALAGVGAAVGASASPTLVRTDEAEVGGENGSQDAGRASLDLDDTPWVLPATSGWAPQLHMNDPAAPPGPPRIYAAMNEPTADLHGLVETFPGSLASFSRDNLHHRPDGLHLQLDPEKGGLRPFRSGAFASAGEFTHGRFEATIRPAPGPGIVTGFFLHRASPRQEIDIEFVGLHPTRMLTNVYFNPGDDGAAFSYGYRGSPCWVELGFDASTEFHTYGIDWRPGCISWLVDGSVVHQRASWDPTPIPHLPMRLHANVWVPRSRGLAGQVDDRKLPAAAVFKDVGVTG
jgi:GR25 family glycosyltransferase involved in LPS biosynthesis